MSRIIDEAVAAERSRLGVLSRRRPNDRTAIAEARRDLAAAKLRAHVRKVLSEAPPLTPRQLHAIVDALVDGRREDLSASAAERVNHGA